MAEIKASSYNGRNKIFFYIMAIEDVLKEKKEACSSFALPLAVCPSSLEGKICLHHRKEKKSECDHLQFPHSQIKRERVLKVV